MKKQIIRQMLVVVFCLGLSFGVFDKIPFVREDLSGVIVSEAASNPYVGGNSNCTWVAWQKAYDLAGVALPGFTGNAIGWYQGAINAGYTVSAVPREKSIAVWENGGAGHVAYVSQVSGNQIYVMEGGYNGGYHEGWCNASGQQYNGYYSKLKGYIYLMGSTPASSADNLPKGCVDNIECIGPGKIRVRGWAFDPDNTSIKLAVHVYVGGTGEGHAITADKRRDDVEAAYPGVGSYHGFENIIETTKSGNQSVTVFAINIGKNGSVLGYSNPILENGQRTINITADTTKPTVSGIRVTNITRGGYTVTATATDNVGVKEVNFAVWTSKDDQDDLKWTSGTKINDTTWQCQISVSDHNMESGDYVTHVYAVDRSDNKMGVSAPLTHVPDVTENEGINAGDRFEAHIVNSSTGYYLYQSVDPVIDAKHWDLLSGEYNGKNIEGLQRETWIFSRQSDGYYTIQNQYSGKYLDIAYSNKNSGANVILADLNADDKSDNQKFRLYKSSKGYYITAKCTPYTVLDIKSSESGTSVGANYYDPANTNQIFNIVRWDQVGNDIKDQTDDKQNVDLKETNKSGNGKTAVSNVVGSMNKAVKIGKVVILLGKYRNKNQIFLKWGKVKGAKGYQIQYALSKKKLGKGKRKNMKKTSVKIGKLKKKKTYYVRVRAYKTMGKKMVYGKWSTIKKIKVKI